MTGPIRAIVCTRLKDMTKVHPDQDNTKRCARCDWPVGIYPTGQRALKNHPDTPIWCSVCCNPFRLEKDDELRPAGSWEEIAQEARDSKRAR